MGAVPDAAVIVASGLGSDRDQVQNEVSVGLGTLAGSTVMLLTLAWSWSLMAGRCDLDQNGVAIDETLTIKDGSKWTQTGVSVEADVPQNSKLMMASNIAYLVIQIPAFYYLAKHVATGSEARTSEDGYTFFYF